MSRYHRFLLGAILGRLSIILVMIAIQLAVYNFMNSWFSGFIMLFSGVVGGLQVGQIINYLSMSKLEFIEQIKWEKK